MKTVLVTGAGAVTAAGIGVDELERVLRGGPPAIGSTADEALPVGMLAARLPPFDVADALSRLGVPEPLRAQARRVAHRAPVGLQAALLAAVEAWTSAGLHARAVDPRRWALVVGGHNLNQQLSWDAFRSYADRLPNVPPSYALRFLDSDCLGSVSEALGIRGEGLVAGGASASGSVAVIQGMRLIRDGLADGCVVVAAPCELSPLELHAFGALGVLMRAEGGAYQPFAQVRSGFVYGEGAAALVLERASAEPAANAVALLGGCVALDATRLPTPTLDGEVAAMEGALRDARCEPGVIDYINPHATGSVVGDETELDAIERVFGARAREIWLNASKSLFGHCLTSAGLVELVSCVVQMQKGFLHANPFLSSPIREGWRFVGADSQNVEVTTVLKNGFGFGGINTSLVLQRHTMQKSSAHAVLGP